MKTKALLLITFEYYKHWLTLSMLNIASMNSRATTKRKLLKEVAEMQKLPRRLTRLMALYQGKIEMIL